jgi:protein-L-isoaspartate(D-aspartate) O-methyltransferase
MMKDGLKRMLDTIAVEAINTSSFTGRKEFSTAVMQAMAKVDRKKFVIDRYLRNAYDDGALPIGHGQTISQPYMVALMTDLLDLTQNSIVLEVGTGSGYQAAILSKLAKQVYSIERVAELATAAQQRLRRLGYDNVHIECRNGYLGWQEKAPFDAIVVTAAAPYVPPALIEQLKPGGRMVIPLGQPYAYQELYTLSKDQSGTITRQDILGVAFVPLVDENVNPEPHEGSGI